MKKTLIVLTAITGVLFMASCNNAAKTEETTAEATATEPVTYTVATDASTVKWKGVMLGVKEHFGTIALKEGSVTVQGGQLTGGKFTVDMATIAPKDSAYDAKGTPDKLVGHLSSPDFFDVANNPTATFEITSVTGNEAKGNLTVRGKTNEETVKNIVVTEAEGKVTATGTLTFDRKKYDVAFDMPVKDLVISNDIELTIELTAAK